MSNSVNIFLRKTVELRGTPFPVNTVNQRQQASTGFGELCVGEVTKMFNNAVEQDISDKKNKGLSAARYDMKKKLAYLENADGTREYV